MKRSFTAALPVCRIRTHLASRVCHPLRARIDDDPSAPFRREKKNGHSQGCPGPGPDRGATPGDTPPECDWAEMIAWHTPCSGGPMDAIVALGVALVGGGLFVVAPAQTLLAVAGAMVILWRSPKPPGLARVVLTLLALGASGWRAHRAVETHEARRSAVAAAMPAPSRCSAHAEVLESPVSAHGSLRWLALLDALECDDARAPSSAPSQTVTATLYGGPESLARGDRVEMIAQLARPQRFWNDETGDPRP